MVAADLWSEAMIQIIFSPQGIGSVGLVLDIVGAILLFIYGLPENISREGYSNLVTEEVDEKEVRLANFYDRMGRLGLLLLISGFVLQLVANLLQIPAVATLLRSAMP